MAKTEKITPSIHVGYMISEILMKKYDPQRWWVVWYNTKNMSSAGMKDFASFEEASEWNENNSPIGANIHGGGPFDRSTIIYSGE